MIEQGEGGSIVNTSSMVGKYGQPSGFAYPTSKFAVNGLTLSLARELAKHKIRVERRARGVTTPTWWTLARLGHQAAHRVHPCFGRIRSERDRLCLSVPGQRYVRAFTCRAPCFRRRPVAPVSTSQSHTERPPSFKGRRPFSHLQFQASAKAIQRVLRLVPSSRRRRPAPVPSSKVAGPRRPCAVLMHLVLDAARDGLGQEHLRDGVLHCSRTAWPHRGMPPKNSTRQNGCDAGPCPYRRRCSGIRGCPWCRGPVRPVPLSFTFLRKAAG